MRKPFIIALTIIGIMVFSGAAPAGPPPWHAPWRIVYDGYLEADYGGAFPLVGADTLIVVTNSSPQTPMGVWIEIYKKDGILEYEGYLWDGGIGVETGSPASPLGANQFAWINLGQVINRTTQIVGTSTQGAEKFSFRIWTAPGHVVPVVEIKQVVYDTPTELEPGLAIWQPGLFRTWSEAALGGLSGTGVVKQP